MSTTLHPMLNIAVRAARAAGAIINRASLDTETLKVSAKGINDFVTEVDQAAEAAIIEILLEAYPGHAILGEESGRTHGSRHSDYLWIIDPLDGTTNFIHGLPVYCVSIALAFRGRVEQAVVYDPTRNDLFLASRGRGAFLNDRRLRVSRRTRLSESLIGTGFPFRKGDSFQQYMAMLEVVMRECAGIRRPGAAALDLCYVAAGWYDGFFEMGLSPWDMAAGSLIVTEAGGLVGNFTGDADFLYQREIVAASPKIYGQLVPLVAPYSKAIVAAAEASDDAGEGSADAVQPAQPAQPAQGADSTSVFVAAARAVALPSASARGDAGDGGVAGSADGAAPGQAASAGEPEPKPRPRRIRKEDLPPPPPEAADARDRRGSPGARGPRGFGDTRGGGRGPGDDRGPWNAGGERGPRGAGGPGGSRGPGGPSGPGGPGGPGGPRGGRPPGRGRG